MGSAFRLPIWSGPSYEDVINWCAQNEIHTIGADAAGSHRLYGCCVEPIVRADSWTGICRPIGSRTEANEPKL